VKLVSTVAALRACLANLPSSHLRHTVYFKKTKTACYFIAYDFNFQIIRQVEATGTESFFGCDPEKLCGLLKAEQGLVTLNVQTPVLTVTTANKTVTLTTTHHVEDLALPDPLSTPAIDTATFISAVKHVALSASIKAFHGIHQAVRLECGETLKLVATDHYQLAIEEVSLNTGLHCVTHLNADLLQRVIAKLNPKENLKVFLQDDTFVLEQRSQTFTMVTMDGMGTYPRYECVLPPTFERTLCVNAPTLFQDVRAATKSSTEKNHAVFLACDNETCRLTTRGDYAKQRSTATHLLAFDGVLLGQILERFMGEIQLHVVGVRRPCLITEPSSTYRVLLTTLDISEP
jgi:DNA polymerase III sliding clamp (beta) subunit (PCNA family)